MDDDSARRDAKMKKWLMRKELYDNGIKYLGMLRGERADEEESLREVAIALAAIDRMLGTEEAGPRTSDSKSGPVPNKPKTMKSAWLKWTIANNHSFSNIRLSPEELKQFSGGAREFMDQDGDTYILLSLKYSAPAPPKSATEPGRPLTSDQKLQNAIYMRECKRVWRDANEELRERLLEHVTRAEQRAMKAGVGDIAAVRANAESSGLYALSIRRLKQWVEDDDDMRAAEAKEAAAVKANDAKANYEQYVKSKDSLRIRLPSPPKDGRPPRPASAPRMSFGGAMSTVRPKAKGPPTTTVELMQGSGLKYVHAIGRGKQGIEGDLEKSRKKLLESGVILKENFDPDDDMDYRTQKLENTAAAESTALRRKLKQDSTKAFEEWTQQKTLTDSALKHLSLLESPAEYTPVIPDWQDAKEAKSVRESTALMLTQAASNGALDRCIEVGAALKAVDRGLFNDWFRWCNKTVSHASAVAMWDFFEPKACDVHSAASSQAREAFMKLLRPGVDYKRAFTEFAEKKAEKVMRRSRAAEDKHEVIAKLVLNRAEMRTLLLDLGILLNEHEINALIDAFDENGDGVVTLKEFLDFIGPARDRNSGASSILKRRCCWRTTCRKTGMANAFAVSAPTKDQLRQSKQIDNEESKRGRDSAGRSVTQSIAGKTEFIKLGNGEIRVKVELSERRKREDILIRCGLLKESDRSSSRARPKDDDDYSDDDQEDDGYGSDDFEQPQSRSNMCDYCKWSMDDRKNGIKKLASMTTEARREEALKQLMKEGKPPAAPRLWTASITDKDVGDEVMRQLMSPSAVILPQKDALIHEMLLRWSSEPGELVSFYVLEYGGVVKFAATGERKYKEIFRDPKDAVEVQFEMKYWKCNLEPASTHAFRIRAVNGFGAGEYTYRMFTTRPAAPEVPRVMSLSSDTVILKWVFSALFSKRMDDLRRIFDLADADGSGAVSREELAAVLDAEVSSSPELLSLLRKTLAKYGLDPKHGFSSLFDKIEGDDDNTLSWEEFEKFFVAAGFTSTNAAGASTRQSMTSIATSSGKNVDSKLTYVVEQCESEFNNTYKECLRTTLSQGTVSRLRPGETYRFRVYAVNVDGVEGPRSDTIVIHTMLETPVGLAVTSKVAKSTPSTPYFSDAITSNLISIQWRPRQESSFNNDASTLQRLLGDWAGVGAEDGAVSIDTVFANYDRNSDGTISKQEFEFLLRDLHVEPSEERIAEAFRVFDTDGNGVISFDEFKRWWHRGEVSYVVKRSNEVYDSVANAATAAFLRSSSSKGMTQSQASVGSKATRSSRKVESPEPDAKAVSGVADVPMPLVVYRGKQPRCDVAGLTPNRLYHFKVRFVGSRSYSCLSSPLVLMTAPLPVDQPVLITVGASVARVKWYGTRYGAYKFCVQLQQYDKTINQENSAWTTAFVGSETIWMSTTLVPDSNYALRVMGVNCQNVMGAPSKILKFRTLPRTEGNDKAISCKNIATTFTVECTTDICVGDTIVMTERLFSAPKAATATNIGETIAVTSRKSTTLKKSSTAKSTVKAESSVYSIGSSGRGGFLVTGEVPENGTFIGDRTLAAHVIRDSYKLDRDACGKLVHAEYAVDPQMFAQERRLWLEVVWQHGNTDLSKKYTLTPGTVVERSQKHIEHFEVFRCTWAHEDRRKSFVEDVRSLSECFVPANC